MHTNEFGVDAIVGEKYRAGGELGKPLYQLNIDDGTSQIYAGLSNLNCLKVTSQDRPDTMNFECCILDI